jgi:hypothetical protein
VTAAIYAPLIAEAQSAANRKEGWQKSTRRLVDHLEANRVCYDPLARLSSRSMRCEHDCV